MSFKNLLVYRFEENSLLSNAETLEQFDEQISFSLAGDFIFKRLKFLERFEENLDTEDDTLLQMQAELYLAVDLYRKMISHIYITK